MSIPTPLVYIGPTGAGLGFQLSGIAVMTCDDDTVLVRLLRQLKEEKKYHIIFVDEGLATKVLDDVERLNEDTLPAIVLLPNPAAPRNLAQEKMNKLVIKAVGSDILGT